MKSLHTLQPQLAIPNDVKYFAIRWNALWQKRRLVRYYNGKIQITGEYDHNFYDVRENIIPGWVNAGRRNHSLDQFRPEMLEQ